MANLHAYGITYGDKVTEFIECKDTFTVFKWRFEYNVMLAQIEYCTTHIPEDDYIGMFSHKFTQKTGLSRAELYSRFNYAQHFDHTPLVYNLSPYLGSHIGNFNDWSNEGHKNLTNFLIRCCKHVGFEYENNPPHVIYANQFIARKDIYMRYMNEVIKPCLELLEGEMWNEVNVPAGYTAGLKLAELKKHTGLDFYNYVPFILERMFMQFVNHYKLKCISLV